MKRLTRKIKGANNYCEFELKDQPYKSFLDIEKNSDLEWLDVCNLTLAIDKLGQLEDIEKELGIDLITLFKALNSCWFKYNFEIIGDIRPSLRFINGEWCLISNIERIAFPYPLRLYGKIWSLDRSELENGR